MAKYQDPDIDYRINPEYHRFCDQLGLGKTERDDTKIASKVAFLYDWAKESVGEDGTAISLGIRNLVSRLGVSFKGEILVDHLYQWTRIDQDSEKSRVAQFEENLIKKRLGKTEINPEEKKEIKVEAKSEIVKQIEQVVKEEVKEPKDE